jgi:uncharacterized protein (DUF433 family)
MNASSLTTNERELVLRALRFPRGRYSAERAAQLSAVPARTLHDWATSHTLTPDWMRARPRGWSYRDIVYVRLLAWLRSKGMERDRASHRVEKVRKLLAGDQIDPEVRSDGNIFLLGDEEFDRFTGQQAFDGMTPLLDVFTLTEPIEGISRAELWGPSLLRPSTHTYISPWVLHGEPCVTDSRVPTSALYALRVERGLANEQIQALYPQLSASAVGDALELETRLRAA